MMSAAAGWLGRLAAVLRFPGALRLLYRARPPLSLERFCVRVPEQGE
jgi:hypothetical protein